MAEAKAVLQQLQSGVKNIKPLQMAWFQTDPNDPPRLVPDFNMPAKSGQGFTRLSHEEAVNILKKIVNEQTGLSEYDRLLQSGDQDEKNMLANGSAVSSRYVNFNGSMYQADKAAELANYSPEQLKSELNLINTRQQEVANQAAINAQAQDQKPPTPNNLTPSNGALDNVHPADAKVVNDLYQKYFDRTATSAELANWSKETPQMLEQFLSAEQKKYGYVSKEMGADRKKRYDDAIAIIDASDLPPEIKSLWKTTVGNYPDATDFKPEEIINTFNKIKTDTIDPYYKELADVAIKDLGTAFGDLQTARTAELEAERANSGQAVRQAKEGLEKSGMTFTGKGIEDLGAGSAYAQPGALNVATPVQTPFAGLSDVFYEGNVNQANRLVSTSSAARYAANQQALGRRAEDFLGSSATSAVPGLNFTAAGVTAGSNDISKQGKMASTLQGIIDNWATSQKLKTNI